MAKVIHVHLLNRGRYERKDYYFASISAIYTVLTAEDVGVTKGYLLHAGLSGNGSVATKCAIIKQSAYTWNEAHRGQIIGLWVALSFCWGREMCPKHILTLFYA